MMLVHLPFPTVRRTPQELTIPGIRRCKSIKKPTCAFRFKEKAMWLHKIWYGGLWRLPRPMSRPALMSTCVKMSQEIYSPTWTIEQSRVHIYDSVMHQLNTRFRHILSIKDNNSHVSNDGLFVCDLGGEVISRQRDYRQDTQFRRWHQDTPSVLVLCQLSQFFLQQI
jgi:hypothetical protein